MKVKIESVEVTTWVFGKEFSVVCMYEFKSDFNYMRQRGVSGKTYLWKTIDEQMAINLVRDIQKRGWVDVDDDGNFYYEKNNTQGLRQKKLERILT